MIKAEAAAIAGGDADVFAFHARRRAADYPLVRTTVRGADGHELELYRFADGTELHVPIPPGGLK